MRIPIVPHITKVSDFKWPTYNSAAIKRITEPVPDYLVRYKLDGTDSITWSVGYEGRSGKSTPDAKGAYFNGTNVGTKNSDSAILATGTSARTFTCWFNSIYTAAQHAIFSVGNASSLTADGWEVRLTGGGLIRYRCNAVDKNGNSSWNDGKWHFLAITINAPLGIGTFYVDGVADGTFAPENYNITNSNDVEIGDGVTNNFNGLLDDIRVYNRVLSSAEITALKNYTNDWSPSLVTTSLWLDAQDQTTITEVLGAVSQWGDKSGNANNATQGIGANQPITKTRNINGLNTLDLNGTSQFLNLASTLELVNGMVFAIIEVDSVVSANMILSSKTNNVQLKTRNDNTISYESSSPYWISPTISSGLITVSVPAMVGFIGDTNMSFSINGSFEVGSSGNDGSGFTLFNQIGARTSSFNFFNGKIGEVIFVESNISNTIRQKIEGYLAWKWGLVSDLATANPSHPYKSLPPRI